MVGDGEPSQVSIPVFDDPIVSEDALKAEPKLFGKQDRGRIEFVGGPLQTPTTKKTSKLIEVKVTVPNPKRSTLVRIPFLQIDGGS